MNGATNAHHIFRSGAKSGGQALTEEHMESLRNIRPEKMLWIEV